MLIKLDLYDDGAAAVATATITSVTTAADDDGYESRVQQPLLHARVRVCKRVVCARVCVCVCV